MIEVNTPTLMSVVDGMIRTAISAASSSAAPVNALGTSSRAGSWPIRGRTRCGATRPIKPIVPVTETAPPTPSATPMMTSSRNRPTSTPRLCAVSSPRLSARNALRWLSRTTAPAMMNGNASITWRKLRSSSEPSSQKAISSAANGFGERFITSAVAAPARLEIARPERMSNSRPALRPAIPSSTNTDTNAIDDAGDRQCVGAHVGPTERDHQHRAEGCRLRRSEQGGRRQRIAQQALQCCAGQTEDGADRQP